MIITSSNIVYYFLERGLVTFESVVDGDLMVVNTSRRNRNFKVIRKHSPSYFLKQVQNWEPQAIATLQREATCYWLAQNDADFAPLAALMPKYYKYDPAWHVLIVELLSGGENLSEYHRRLGKFPTEAATLLGNILGTYHRRVGTGLKNSPQNAVFPKMVPWILSVHQQAAYQSSAANSQLLGIVQKYPEFPNSISPSTPSETSGRPPASFMET